MAKRTRAEQSRVNGSRSRGPTTPRGLAVSSANALRHGLLARSPTIRGESPEALAEWTSRVVAELAPRGAVAEALALRVAELTWRLQRAGAAEARLAELAVADAEARAIRAVGGAAGVTTLAELSAQAQRELAVADAAEALLGAPDDTPLPEGDAVVALLGRLGHVAVVATSLPAAGALSPRATVRHPTWGALRLALVAAMSLHDEDEDEDEDARAALREQVVALRRRALERGCELLRVRAEAHSLAARLAAEAPVDQPQVRRHEAHLHRLLRETLRALRELGDGGL